MRYVDVTVVLLPNGWLARAQVAQQAVAAGADPNDYAHIWRELKDALADRLHDKCWYCEAKVPRSDNCVDHFRPKNRVSDAAQQHGGYRWLAFDLENFRYSCTFCNCRRKDLESGTSGGKADRFPLIDETTRVYAPGPVHSENVSLLDPCQIDDWSLLGCFEENGRPCPATNDTGEIARVEISIDVYHLAHEALSRDRHRAAVDLLSMVRMAKELFPRAQAPGEVRDQLNKHLRRIRQFVDRTAPYSGEMLYLLRGQRSEHHPWVQKIIDAA
ncbi:MAG TPA: hypothetical protein VEK57_23630 [Thermoanaerobaculia bacterium]|nr:hypothetical protein [Thermoanaerobaculia bacterium]